MGSLLVFALMLSSADDVSIEPVTAMAIGAGGGAGALAGLVGGALLAASYPEGTPPLLVTGTLLGGTGLGAAIGGAGVALVMAPEDAVLSATTAFAAAPMGMIGGGVAAVLVTTVSIVAGGGAKILGPLLVVGVFGGAVTGGALGAVVGAGLPQE